MRIYKIKTFGPLIWSVASELNILRYNSERSETNYYHVYYFLLLNLTCTLLHENVEDTANRLKNRIAC